MKDIGHCLKKIFLILISIIHLSFLTAQTYSYNIPTSIPDDDCTSIELNVDGTNAVLDPTFGLESVCIDVTHVYLEDLEIILISPGGTEVLLTSANGSGGESYTNTCFVGNTSAPSITTGSGTFTGDFQPEEPLGTINNGIENKNGVWILFVCDEVPLDEGTVHSFSLTFGDNPATVPSATNDECNTAIPLLTNNNYTCSVTNAGTISDATDSGIDMACTTAGLTFDDDVWFSFIATSEKDSILISTIQGSTTDLIYQVFSGSCGSLVNVMCYDPADPDASSDAFAVNNLIAGNLYLLRIASRTAGGGYNTTFNICILQGIPDPPPNDNCINAIAIAVNDCYTEGSVAGGTPSPESLGCTGTGDFTNDVWYSFVPTSTNHDILIKDIIGINKDSKALDFQLSHGSCSNLIKDFCFYVADQGEVVLIPFDNYIIGQTYFLRIATTGPAPLNTSFTICIESPPPAPVNDECVNAIALTRNLYDCNYKAGNLYGATNNDVILSCNEVDEFGDPSYPYFDASRLDDDVWYKFMAIADTQEVNIINITGTTTDLIYQVFEESCSPAGSFFCFDEALKNEFILTGLTIGQTYYIRVATYEDTPQNVSFDIVLRSCNLMVCNTNDEGTNTLREAILCADPNDIIQFSPEMAGQSILLKKPGLVINKPLTWEAMASPVYLSNRFISNTEVLLEIQNTLQSSGIAVMGQSSTSMKVVIRNGGQWKVNN